VSVPGHGFRSVRDIESMTTPRLAVALLFALAAGCSDGKAVSAPAPRPEAPTIPNGGGAGARSESRASAGRDDSTVAGTSSPGAPARTTAPAAPAITPRPPTADELARYRWLEPGSSIRPLDATIAAPRGFARVPLAAGSFGAFLRSLPLLPDGSAVHAHDGRTILAGGDPRLTAVVAMDQGTRDLQQCADTAIRLHAEWLWSRSREGEIGYHFTSGDLSTWSAYAAGDRPVVAARSVKWARNAAPSAGRTAFRAWLDLVFTYAGTVSLARETAKVERKDLRVGDVLVLPGGPGHTVVVLDLAVDEKGRRRALLGQGFMPAQEAHVLASAPGEPWFDLDGGIVDTPFWAPFPWSSLRRMRTARGDTE
jgi:hypothetical protein